ncbi:hypothetical protein chiPu_0015095 [Chiloscyllium punctatum]|uniref:Uncharacterized protein n=1 Tax=Chiloscyllium punctatum TaxID=137246 RepID=A0A401T1T7_CHIPU|nr:hypothetical protein [Chiloscyllium punctatum]
MVAVHSGLILERSDEAAIGSNWSLGSGGEASQLWFKVFLHFPTGNAPESPAPIPIRENRSSLRRSRNALCSEHAQCHLWGQPEEERKVRAAGSVCEIRTL